MILIPPSAEFFWPQIYTDVFTDLLRFFLCESVYQSVVICGQKNIDAEGID